MADVKVTGSDACTVWPWWKFAKGLSLIISTEFLSCAYLFDASSPLLWFMRLVGGVINLLYSLRPSDPTGKYLDRNPWELEPASSLPCDSAATKGPISRTTRRAIAIARRLAVVSARL
jgi:hypothetical protein